MLKSYLGTIKLIFTKHMLQQKYKQLANALITTLKDFDYTLLTPSITNQYFPIIKLSLRSRERESFLQNLTESLDFQVVQSKLDATTLTTELENGQLITIEIYHYFHSDRLTYLNAKEVFKHRQVWDGVYTPKLEHLLEFSILNSFLNEEGLDRKIIRQFEDLHIFLQEGLLDYFNTKYDTFFTSLHDLVDYKETVENHFRKQLRQFPANKFSNRMRLGWVNIKQLLKRSAVFSYFF